MQIQFLASPEFTIDQNNVLHRRGSWLLTAENPAEDFSLLSQEWAGNVGEPWRQPIDDGSAYTLDDAITITRISSQAPESNSCIITFEGTENFNGSGSITPLAENMTLERCKDLSEYKTAVYQLVNVSEDALPQPGDLIDWAGTDYRCESLKVVSSSGNTAHATLTAVRTAPPMRENIQSETTAVHQQQKTSIWLIQEENLSDFLEQNALYQPANWAGSNYYISSIKTEPANSALRCKVTLHARYCCMQLIEALRSEEIVHITAVGTMKKLFIWRSRWRATPEDRGLFEAMLGESAADWTNDERMIVCRVEPQQISDREFEYLLEARYPEDIVSSGEHSDYDLPDRHEFYTRTGEMRFTPRQCGYRRRRGGKLRKIGNWQGENECPLNRSEALPMHWVDQPVKLLEIVEVTYRQGNSGEHLSEIAEWFTSQRISSEPISNISGSFLRYDLDVDDMTDKKGNNWTRIQKIYRLAPENMSWNNQYWLR